VLRKNTLKSLNSVRGDPRLNFYQEMFLCAILLQMVSFDADLHSKHENQVASAISLAVSKLIKGLGSLTPKNGPNNRRIKNGLFHIKCVCLPEDLS